MAAARATSTSPLSAATCSCSGRSRLLLGALHALEPGHAKTLIASFVVATRGSVPQAVLLGQPAAISHFLLIWVLAGTALYFVNEFIGDELEP